MALGLPVLGVVAAAQEPLGQAPAIRAIELHREDIFDSTETRFWAFRLLNALHVETRPAVIRRELLFAPGEPYDSARVNESARNLRALGIFRDVLIDSVTTDSGLVVRVWTLDAWTTTVGMALSTSGTQFLLDLSLRELNLLGTRTSAVLAYRNDPDRSAILAGVDLPRVLYRRVSVGGTVVEQSDGRAAVVSVRAPFLSLSSRVGASVAAQAFDGRVLRYAQGDPVPYDSLRRRFEMVRAEGAVALSASPRGFVRVGLAAQLRREDYGPEATPDAVPRTLTGAAGPTLTVRRPRYVQVRDVDYAGRVEDVDLGAWLQADLLLAPRAWGYERDGVGLALVAGVGHDVPLGFARYAVRTTRLRTRAGTDSSTDEASATLVLRPRPGHLLVGFGGAGRLVDTYPGSEYDLGLGRALRGFPSHAFTGDRYYQLNAEYRWMRWPAVLGLASVGAGAFVDHAGAWFEGQPVRRGTSVGMGVRVGSLREASAAVWRLDLSRRLATDREPAGWVVSLGQGFPFRRL